jgi:hypothetical protein
MMAALRQKLVSNPFIWIWILNCLIFDILAIEIYLVGCSWPKVSKSKATQVVVIADPQLTDAYSYKQSRVGNNALMKGSFAFFDRILFR